MKTLLKKTNSYIRSKFRLYKPSNWQDIEYFDVLWKKRIDYMARLIDARSKSVLDLGCGKGWLKEFLPAGMEYVGVDYQPREGLNNIVCDFNAGEFPNVHAEVVFCSGILEYIEDLPVFVKNICAVTNQVVLSYCSVDFHEDLKVRRSLGWKNHLSSLDIINLFLKNSFALTDVNLEMSGTLILKLEKRKLPVVNG